MLAAALALTLGVSAAPAPSRPAPEAPSDERLVVLSAMQAELSRSMERLRLEGYEAPYFVAYQVTDVARHQVGARFGALFQDDARRERNLFVDLRVGSYELDSSAPDEGPFLVAGEGPSWYAPKEAPLEGDPAALRNALWLATDEKLKEALSSYFKKRSRQVYRQDDPDRPPSFTREAPSRHVDAPRPFPLDRDRWKALARETTARFRAHPAIFDGSLRISAEKQVRWFASSEGSALVTERTLYGVHLQAVTRAPDGQLLEDVRVL